MDCGTKKIPFPLPWLCDPEHENHVKERHTHYLRDVMITNTLFLSLSLTFLHENTQFPNPLSIVQFYLLPEAHLDIILLSVLIVPLLLGWNDRCLNNVVVFYKRNGGYALLTVVRRYSMTTSKSNIATPPCPSSFCVETWSKGHQTREGKNGQRADSRCTSKERIRTPVGHGR